MKAVRSLETGADHYQIPKFVNMETADIFEYIKEFKDDNIFAICELLRRNVSIDDIFEITRITRYFLQAFANIVAMEEKLKASVGNLEVLAEAKKLGFCDKIIAKLWGKTEIEIFNIRKENSMFPVYRMVDTCHTGAYIPYFYSSYTGENTSILTDKE